MREKWGGGVVCWGNLYVLFQNQTANNASECFAKKKNNENRSIEIFIVTVCLH